MRYCACDTRSLKVFRNPRTEHRKRQQQHTGLLHTFARLSYRAEGFPTNMLKMSWADVCCYRRITSKDHYIAKVVLIIALSLGSSSFGCGFTVIQDRILEQGYVAMRPSIPIHRLLDSICPSPQKTAAQEDVATLYFDDDCAGLWHTFQPSHSPKHSTIRSIDSIGKPCFLESLSPIVTSRVQAHSEQYMRW